MNRIMRCTKKTKQIDVRYNLGTYEVDCGEVRVQDRSKFLVRYLDTTYTTHSDCKNHTGDPLAWAICVSSLFHANEINTNTYNKVKVVALDYCRDHTLGIGLFVVGEQLHSC